jgi:hypothetical protein
MSQTTPSGDACPRTVRPAHDDVHGTLFVVDRLLMYHNPG